MRLTRASKGFTLVELLVVISIVALMISILLPALKGARDAARMVQCTSNMRQWNIALAAYAVDSRDYLPLVNGNGSGATVNQTEAAWFNALPPYVQMLRYREVFTGSAAPTSEEIYDRAKIWFCPSRVEEGKFTSGSGLNSFHYGMNILIRGTNTMLPNLGNIHASLLSIRQPSNSLFMSEPYNNTAYVRPNSLAGTGGNVQWDRHQRIRVNGSFFDGHVETFEGKDGLNTIDTTHPHYANQNLGVIWGVFR